MMDAWTIAERLIAAEARALDAARWDEWLELFCEDSQYWIPAWDDDGGLSVDPLTDVSLVYYDRRAGLEERAFRLTAGRSAASRPLARTTHFSWLVHAELVTEGIIAAETSWRVDFNRDGFIDANFGRAWYHLRLDGEAWRIASKKIELHNDTIDTVLDINLV